jgi:CheY-like chemotaxis protein
MAQILLVDDDRDTLTTFSHFLRSSGYEVFSTASGLQAIQVLQSRSFDLVLADLRLPDISGLDVLGRIRSRGNTTPFIIVTGFVSAEDAISALRLQATDFLEKPVFEQDLLKSVAHALRKHDTHGATVDTFVNKLRPTDATSRIEMHAAARFAHAVMPALNSPTDLRTVADWAHSIGASASALRNWCRVARMSPRRALVFTRMLRAVLLLEGGRQKIENVLDVVDWRTLRNLLRLIGFDDRNGLPADIHDFIARQTVVRDPDLIEQIVQRLPRRPR